MAGILRRLNVRVTGYGERVLVLGHGFGSDQSVWNPMLAHMEGPHRTVVFDLACAGTVLGFRAERYPNLDAYADDLLRILDALNIERCTYVGHSMGASIGVLASIRRPRLFDHLILISFSPRYLNDPSTGYIGGLEQADIDGRVAAIAHDYAAMVVAHAPLLVGPGTPHAVQEFVRTSLQMGPFVASHVTQTVFVCDLREQLRLVTVPCSIIQTMYDVVLPSPLATVQYIADRLMVRPTVHMMDAGGHLPHLTAAEETASFIMPHLIGD